MPIFESSSAEIAIYELQMAMNRFASWLRIPTVSTDGKMGPKTLKLFKELALIPQLFDRLYYFAFERGTPEKAYTDITQAVLARDAGQFAEIVDQRASELNLSLGVYAPPEIREPAVKAMIAKGLKPTSGVSPWVGVAAVVVIVGGVGALALKK